MEEAKYAKVQLVEWERDILWDGVVEEEKHDEMDTEVVEQELNYSNWDMTCPRHYRWELSHGNRKQTRPVQVDLSRTLLNIELRDGTWTQCIQWDVNTPIPNTMPVLDYNDAALIFMRPEMEDARPTLIIPKRKMGATEHKRAVLEQQAKAKKRRIEAVMGNLEFGEETAEGRLGTEGKKSKDTRVVKNIGYAHHSLPAMKLVLTRPELPKSRLRSFHRPVGKFRLNEVLTLQPMPKEKIQAEESTGLGSIRKASDLNPTSGKMILVEYVEQSAPVIQNPGMACRILHYWRPPENKDGKNKAAGVVPEMPNGRTIVLGENDESPFVGDVPPGRMITSLNCKLFKAPLFQHQPRQKCVFLLARPTGKSMKKEGKMYITAVDFVYLAGQVEPQMEVPAPNSRSANDFIRPYMSFHILRLFKKATDGERLKIEDIARAFPNQSGTAIRKRMKEVAIFERGGNDSGWWKKKSDSQLRGEDELRASISPDAVCLYESMMAGQRRLYDAGLTKIGTPSGVSVAINLMVKRLKLRKAQLTALIDAQELQGRAKEAALEDLMTRDGVLQQLEKDIRIARYIHEQLQLTPWYLTNNYVECHLQGKGSGMLQLGGIGDPSGRGEGFSFVRVPQSRAKKKDDDGEASEVQKAVAAVTGTTADLRKLKMKEAGDVLRNLGMADADIKKLRRWDRIHMVRELSSRATAHGVAGSLAKFARGARKSLSSQQQEYRRKCDVIYERQMDVLSSGRTDFSSDEEDEIEDDILEELEKDLEEDILGADDSEMNKGGPKNLFTKGGGGLNRSRQVLAERDDAVELRRLMEEMKEDSTSSKATLPSSAAAAAASSGSIQGRQEKDMDNTGTTTGTQVLKRTTRVIQEDGTETVRIEFITDQKQVGMYRVNKDRLERQRKAALNQQRRMIKRSTTFDPDKPISASKKKKILQDELRQLHRTEQQNRGYQELLRTQGDDAFATVATTSASGSGSRSGVTCTRCGQAGHIKTNRDCPLYSAVMLEDDDVSEREDLVRTTDDPLKLKIKKAAVGDPTKCTLNLSVLQEGHRKHQAEQKKRKLLEAKEQAELYKRPSAISKTKKRKFRLPICHLASVFEIICYKLLKTPDSAYFRNPVDGTKCLDYYTLVKEPIDLKTIASRVEAFEYETSKEFIKDMEQIVRNSKIYNGDSGITKCAAKLLSIAKEELAMQDVDGEIKHLEKLVRRAGLNPVSLTRRSAASKS